MAAGSCWGAVRPRAQSTVHQDLKSRTGSACSLPLSISLSHPTSKRRPSLCQHVGEWSLTSLNINWSQPKEQPYFERREWPQQISRWLVGTDFQRRAGSPLQEGEQFSHYRVKWVIWMYPCPEHIPLTGRGWESLPKAMLSALGMPILIPCFGGEPRIWFGGVSMIWRWCYSPVALESLVEITAKIIRLKKIAESIQSQICFF